MINCRSYHKLSYSLFPVKSAYALKTLVHKTVLKRKENNAYDTETLAHYVASRHNEIMLAIYTVKRKQASSIIIFCSLLTFLFYFVESLGFAMTASGRSLKQSLGFARTASGRSRYRKQSLKFAMTAGGRSRYRK